MSCFGHRPDLRFPSVEEAKLHGKPDRMAQSVSFLDSRQYGHQSRIDDRVNASSWDGKLHSSALKTCSHAVCRLKGPRRHFRSLCLSCRITSEV
jgi:hypothetical protein